MRLCCPANAGNKAKEIWQKQGNFSWKKLWECIRKQIGKPEIDFSLKFVRELFNIVLRNVGLARLYQNNVRNFNDMSMETYTVDETSDFYLKLKRNVKDYYAYTYYILIPTTVF